MRTLANLFLTFAKIGAFTFGGGYAMISLIDHECVERKQWITSEELTDITVIAESTPGPIAINCATFVGYRQKGFTGAAVATLGMVLPSFNIILIISFLFDQLLSYELVAKAFAGIRAAVVVLIIWAALKMIKKMMAKSPSKSASLAFVAVSFITVLTLNELGVNFSSAALIIVSGIVGFLLFSKPWKEGDSR